MKLSDLHFAFYGLGWHWRGLSVAGEIIIGGGGELADRLDLEAQEIVVQYSMLEEIIGA